MKRSSAAIHEEIKEALHIYTGTECDFSYVPDPAIEGVYAVQADLENLKAQFLLTRSPRTTYKITCDVPLFEVEEVEFTQWPPVMRP